VRRLVEKRHDPGIFRVDWDGKSRNGGRLGSGVYFIKFITGSHIETQKLVYLR
jgi:hypothetical protein